MSEFDFWANTDPAKASGRLTETDLLQALWNMEHENHILYEEFGMVTECVTCGVEKPV